MNKNLKIGIIAIACSFGLMACEKDEENANGTVTNGVAYIKGRALVNSDLSNDTSENGSFMITYEKVPQGTTLFARFDSRDLVLNPNNSITYEIITLSTKVDANGEYSFSVPANSKQFSVTITPEDYFSTIKLTDSTSKANVRCFYPGGNAFPNSVFNGITRYLDVTYNYNL